MFHFIVEPLQYIFIQRALMASVLVGLVCALLGVYVVLRKMSNTGHALTHSALPGLVIAYLAKFNLLLGALGATVLTAIGIGVMAKDEKVYEDTATGMIPTVMFAGGVLLISTTRSYRDMSSMLFGNILGVTDVDLMVITLMAAIMALLLWLCKKELVLFSVDCHYARMVGINTNFLRYGLLLLLALAVVVGIQAVGTILTNALLIGPVATARLLTNKFNTMVTIACIVAVVSCVAGVYMSYYASLSSGASIVMVCALCFLGALLIKKMRP